MTACYQAVHVGEGRWKVTDKRTNIHCTMFGDRKAMHAKLYAMTDQLGAARTVVVERHQRSVANSKRPAR